MESSYRDHVNHSTPRHQDHINNTAEVVDLYRSGMSQLRVARHLGMGEDDVRRILNAAGVERRRQPSSNDELAAEAIPLHRDEGLSALAISKRLNARYWVVRKILRDAGFTLHRGALASTRPIQHGTRSGYQRRCRCDECVMAWLDYLNDRNARERKRHAQVRPADRDERPAEAS